MPVGVEVDENGMRVVTRQMSIEGAFKKAAKEAGQNEGTVMRRWGKFLDENPSFGVKSSG